MPLSTHEKVKYPKKPLYLLRNNNIDCNNFQLYKTK